MAGRGAQQGKSRCPHCAAPILTQLVGDHAALNVVADLRPLTPEQLTAITTPNRLVWCLRDTPHMALKLRWTGTTHPANCPRQHLTEHRCTPQPTTLF